MSQFNNQDAIIDLNDNGYNNGASNIPHNQMPPPYSECIDPSKEYSDSQPLLQSPSAPVFRNYASVPYTQVIIVGGCPACRVGVLEDDYTCAGILCAVLCFPIGLLCCLALKQRRCTNCGAIFG